jgi:hypothetical protein
VAVSSCRLGLHRWKREWGVAGPYRVCRICGTPATAKRVAGHVTARALSIAVAVVTVGVVALILAVLADAVFDRGAPPNYRLGATTNCLRAHGYRVSRGSRDFGFPTISITRKGVGYLATVTFTSGEGAARRVVEADSDSIPEPRERNVVLANEGGPFPQFLHRCLKSL